MPFHFFEKTTLTLGSLLLLLLQENLPLQDSLLLQSATAGQRAICHYRAPGTCHLQGNPPLLDNLLLQDQASATPEQSA